MFFLKGAGASFVISTIILGIYIIISDVDYLFDSFLFAVIYLVPFNYVGCSFGELMYHLTKYINNISTKIFLYGLLGYIYGYILSSNLNTSELFSNLIIFVLDYLRVLRIKLFLVQLNNRVS
jgi:hypothetical protein